MICLSSRRGNLSVPPLCPKVLVGKGLALDRYFAEPFVALLSLFFDEGSSVRQREHALNAMDQHLLKHYVKFLAEGKAASPRTEKHHRAHALAAALLQAIAGHCYSSPRRRLRKILVTMHTDRPTPLNKDFGCVFRNNSRDLLLDLVMLLHSYRNGPNTGHDRRPARPWTKLRGAPSFAAVLRFIQSMKGRQAP